ncbi:FAD-dependent oxidoreductase [Pseudonocardia sichuanensis]
MDTHEARVIVIGAGVGGLALAHGLRRAGIEVAAFDRDPSSDLRMQGYRIHIDRDGNAALAACLPPEVLDLLQRTSGRSGDRVAGYDHRLRELFAQTFPPAGDEITNVDRLTLRRGLLTGLDDVVHFDRTFTHYEELPSGRVRAVFADGSDAVGDLIVGADGVRSAVRRQFLPHSEVIDLGIRCLYGRMTLTDETRDLVPADIGRGFSLVTDGSGYGAGLAPVHFRERPAGAHDYLMTVLVATTDRLGVPDETLFGMSGPELHGLATGAVRGWHPTVREIFAHADPGSFFPITIRAARRVEPWEPGNVTLLGDAIHAMPPAGGVGANTALRDAALLTCEIAHGDRPLRAAVAAYERQMLPHGFDTVDSSVHQLGRMLGTATLEESLRLATARHTDAGT